MNAEELKQELHKIFGEQVKFNKEFDIYAETIKNIDINLLEWCKKIKDQEIKPFRARKMENLFIFIKKIGSSNRCIILKIKNGEFSEIHLANHEYYDRLRKQLGLKENSG